MKNKLKNSIRDGGRVLLLLVLMLVGATQAKAQADYGLKINGVDVTSENCNDLSVIDGVSGTVKYVPETKTLFLENATIATKENFRSIINGTIEGLIINITGENRVTAENAAILLNYNSTIIKGGGILNIENNGAGIYFLNSLVIDSCTVNVTGIWGIAGDVGERETLTIRNANVTATGTDGSICDILSLTLDGCKIYTPEGAAFDETLHAVALNGETVTDRVVITNDTTAIEKVVNYGLRIAGINVTDKNYNDLSEISGVSGTVKYNPDTKTLTLDNTTITPAGESYGIANDSIEGLTINVIGENRLTTSPAAIYSANTSTTIKGEGGTLNIESNSAGIYFEKSLVIDSCTVNINGAYGIGGKDGTSENLTISNAYVMATGSSGSICDIKSLTLEGSVISTPEGATFDETLHAVALDGNKVTSQVVITPDATVGIKDVKENVSARKQGIYSIDGVYLGTNFDSLPKGIYIKDGKKVKK